MPRALRRNVSRDRGLRAILEATGSVIVLFALSWRLAPVLATVIVCSGVAAALYRKATRGIEAKLAKSLRNMSRVAGQAFANIRTVRAFAGARPRGLLCCFSVGSKCRALCSHEHVARGQSAGSCVLGPEC